MLEINRLCEISELAERDGTLSSSDCVLDLLVDFLILFWRVLAQLHQEVEKICNVRSTLGVAKKETGVRSCLVAVASHLE